MKPWLSPTIPDVGWSASSPERQRRIATSPPRLASSSAIRPASVLLTLLAVLLCLARGPAAAEPPPPGTGPREALRLAEEHCRKGELLAAEPHCRRALDAADGETRARGHERLMALYSALGRADRAAQLGLRYRELLRRDGRAGPDRDRRLRDLDVHLGECYLALGHSRTAEAHLERSLAAAGVEPLPAAQQLVVLTSLARAAERRGDRERAARFWQRSEGLALRLLDRRDLPAAERLACTWKLADGYRFRGQPQPAIERLAALLPLHDRLGDAAGKRDTLRRLAGHHAAQGDHAQAQKRLRQALELHDTTGGERVLRAHLAAELAEAVGQQGRSAEAERWRGRAASDYRAVLEDKGRERPEVARIVTAFWRLQQLYQQTSQYDQALRLAKGQAERWAGGLLADARLKSEEGMLRAVLGSFARARPRLRDAVAEMERQDPLNLVDLPRTLGNLAVIEQATGELDRAEALAQRCLALYRGHELPDDLTVVEAHGVLGACAAERGKYALAVDRFRDGIALCERLGPAAGPARSNLLLNVALLHKSQGDTDEAARTCDEALAAYRTFAEPDALGFAAFAAAQASLDAARGRVAEAYARVPRIRELCRKYEIEGGPLVIAAHHCEGLYRLQRREFDAAEKAWRQALTLQEREKLALLVPRTLNYLGLTEELRGRPRQAEALYRRALRLQRDNPQAFPATHFITLWRLAGLAERGAAGEARRLLDEAVAVVEAARLETYGEARERAAFFAQFAPGFERLVDRCLRDGDVEGAFAAATRGRSRTLLDQLQLAGVDPRAALRGPRGAELRRREDELRRRISGLRARAQFIPVEAAGQEAVRTLLDDLGRAQQDYAEVWREVLNANPVMRSLSDRTPAHFLSPARRDRLLGLKTLLLVYHVGRKRSHLLLLGGRGVRPEVFSLVVPASLPDRLAPPEPPPLADALSGRGLVLKERGGAPKADAPPAKASGGRTRPLTQELARVLVDHYRQQIANPAFQPTRGFRLTPRAPDPGESRTAVQRLDLLGNVLLPPEVRRRVREHEAQCLVVVPDGPLHKLPLEALLLEASPRPRYVIDELPPIVYAPSAAVLPLLVDRPAAAGPLSLLTVSDPAYPAGSDVPRDEDRPLPPHVLGLKGQLRRLRFAAEESRRVQASFDSAQVTALTGPAATERAVVAAVAGKRVVHLAAHGFAHDHFGNLFGALALTPPAPGRDDPDDGFLSLHEVYALPLRECELAVLSACATHVGPQRPLEAGVTLANGFLAAGARRVVASHWGVNDNSTSELMATFFAEVAAARKGEKLPYARALQNARLKLRQSPKWSAPFFWAPFVLIGPPD